MDTDLSHTNERQQMVDAVELLFRAGVMSHSGHANLSCRLDGERFLLTTGTVVRNLQAEAMVAVAANGEVEDGVSEACAPEVAAMHLAVYRARPEAGAVVHTHSPALTAFAVANRALPCRYETLHRFGGQIGDVPVAPWTPGRRDEAFLEGIAGALDAHPDTRAVLLANHGVLALAPSPADGAMLIIALEEAAAAELGAAAIGGGRDLPGASATMRSNGGQSSPVASEG